MRKILLSLIITTCALTSSIAQQSKVLFYDDFSQDKGYWTRINRSDYFARIVGGQYLVKSSPRQRLLFVGTQQFIDYRKNFTIELAIKHITGPYNRGFGLVWGSRGMGYSFLFMITANQYFTIGAQAGNKYYSIKHWTKEKSIKTRDFNILKIEKNGIVLKFYINDKPVYSTQFIPFFGQFHGIVVQRNTEIAVDYFMVTEITNPINLATQTPFIAKRERLSSNINTRYSEIAPVISPDGERLYFGRIYDPRNYGSSHECDIWYSDLQTDGIWGPAVHAPKPLNNKGVNAVITVTPDGNALLLEGLYNPDGSFKSEQGISISYRTANGWTVPTPIKIKNFYNKNIYETYYMSNDYKILLMSIERDDSYGDLDLYVSFRRPDGSYSEPKNLGPILNTFASESTPFLASDGKTLYFSSNGHPGYGSHDVFVTRRLDDTWTRWTRPQNLGPIINTPDWDTYLSIPAKGDYAYLSSTYNSYGNEDIFRIRLNKEIQPEPVVLIYGHVLDNETQKPIAAEIKYYDLKTGKEIGLARSNPTTGEYKITLPYGKIYGFRAEAKNYIAQSDNLDLRNKKKQYSEYKVDLYLFPMKINQTIRLNNVFFKIASPELMPESYPELNRIIKLLKDHPTMVVELHGYTDYRGNKDSLLVLSKKRVLTVKKYLVSHGISQDRIRTRAFGGANPVYKGPIEEKHKLNRRVEFKILKL